jgi:hypothetical protein
VQLGTAPPLQPTLHDLTLQMGRTFSGLSGVFASAQMVRAWSRKMMPQMPNAQSAGVSGVGCACEICMRVMVVLVTCDVLCTGCKNGANARVEKLLSCIAEHGKRIQAFASVCAA